MDSKDLVTKDARQNQKHFINVKLVELINYRQSRKWFVSIAVVGMFAVILILMIYFMGPLQKFLDYGHENRWT